MKLIKTPKMTPIPTLTVIGQSIINKMVAATTYFTGAATLLATAQTALNLLVASIPHTVDGTKEDTQTMYLLAKDFKVKLTILVLYADVVAISNPDLSASIIAAAGLLEKRNGVINIPQLSAKRGVAPGTAILRRKAKRGFMYLFEQSVDGGLTYTAVANSTKAAILVGGLAPLKMYLFRSALIKGSVQGDYTAPFPFALTT